MFCSSQNFNLIVWRWKKQSKAENTNLKLQIRILHFPSAALLVLVGAPVLHLDHQEAGQGQRDEDDKAVVHPGDAPDHPRPLETEHPEEEGGEQPPHLAPGQRGQGLGHGVVDLHQQLVEQGDDAAEGEHAADGGGVDGHLGGGDHFKTEQGQPDREAQAQAQKDNDRGLEAAGKLVRKPRV